MWYSRSNGGILKSWESNEQLLMKPLGQGQSINIPLPRIQLPSPQDLQVQGLPDTTTPMGEKRDVGDGLHSHNSLSGNNNLADTSGKQPRRRSISSEGMAQ